MLLLASLIIVMVGVFAGLLMMMRKIMSQNVSAATKHLDEMNQDFLKKEEELIMKEEELKREVSERMKLIDDLKLREARVQEMEQHLMAKAHGDEVDIGHFVGQKVQTIPGIVDTRTIITFRAF